MFRFIGAWLQAVLRYIAAWLQAAAAADDSDAAVASPQAAMDFPVTASLGPLHRPLHSFRATKNNLPDGVSEGEVRRLEADLEELFTELKIVSEADDPSFTARCWMKEVRELRYDAEDFFEELLRSCAGGGDGDGARRSALLTIILWLPSKLKRRCQVAQAFSDLRARAKDASRRRQSFQLGPAATIKPVFGQANVSRSKRQPLGLDESMDKLVKVLAFDSEDAKQQVQVVPIFGSAGVGKTTLARTFYHNFGGKFQCQAFVRVSRNPDMRRMLSSMLSQIKAPPVRGFPDVQDLIDHIREYLQFKRYLIVIDDLWASSTWDIISRAFPDGDCCSRIIVTTEIEDVALACSRYQFKYIYEMSPLNDHQSRKLFLSRVFGSENGCPPAFKEVTCEIIRKCGGLPLAIENIASMLACELDVDQWKHVRDSLPSVLCLRTSPSSEGLKEVLNIIYNNLSPYLKTCLLYLIMYPEGNTISKEDLVKQWVAEDLIGEGQDREKTARDYFDELVSRGMIQPVDENYNDEVLTCTVHHMVLDLIRYKSLEENFIINVSCFQTTPGLPDKVRRLSVQFGGAKCANMPADFMMTQVRSLIFFGFLNCVPSFVEYKLLRVLILHIWADGSKIFDLTGIGELFQLRYLKIDCNITVHLPDEIRQLKFLETLELHAPVNDMPSDISCLPLLRTLGYFDLSKNSLENVQSLGELNNLQDLHLAWSNIAEPDNLKNNMQCLGSILWKLSNLKSLTLVPAASSDAGVLDNAAGASVGISGDILSSMSSPPALLQRLELSGRCCIFSSLPEWTKELGNLCILKISVRKLLRKDIDILKGLPALMALSLYVWTAPVGKVVFDNEGFSVLKYFKFTCAAPCVAFLKGAMPSVRELKLAFNANKMEQYGQIVAGLEYLVELREITAKVGGTGADESDKRYVESALGCAIANHPCTPIIRIKCVDRIFYSEEDTSVTQEQEHRTLEKQHEIQEGLLDPLPQLLISTRSTQTQMRDGGQNEGADRLLEVVTQEREHLILEKQQGIQEEFLDPVPKLLSTTNTSTQTRDGVQGEQIERSKEVVKQEHWILKKQHEIRAELPDPLPDLLISTPSTQTHTRDGGKNGGTERSREVLTREQEHWTLAKQHKHQEELLQGESSRSHSIALYSLKEITDNFSDDRIIGRGSFGVVYMGVLRNGEKIAVKKFLLTLMPGPQKQFESEVYHLMMLQHPNIVRCVGYCCEILHENLLLAQRVERLLCLEYMPRGSLDKYLSDESSGLDWSTCYNIINGICYGLCHLHVEIDKPILHLDLTPGNILLDDGMTPKITGFGLARVLDQEETICPSYGTFNYMAPELLHGGAVTQKSDIFSLGIIILEVVTGHRDYPDVTKTPSDDFIELTLEKWRKVLQRSPGYVSLETDCEQIRRCIQVGLICVNPDRTKRPPIMKVINMLQGSESISMLQGPESISMLQGPS